MMFWKSGLVAVSATIGIAFIYITRTKYQAPLVSCEQGHGYLYPGNYLVYLSHGHSLEKHAKTVSVAVNRDIRDHIWWILPDSYYPGQVVYSGKRVDDELLGGVRADKGVQEIHCEVGELVPEGLQLQVS
ncbi:uncharacterized protein LY89DRAFT_725144 [Mollisia scopiformis]|uniref:Uncharacterized protein n=1 Tax=Mollisia scopiformis TaxID=149040 RepID=A0A132B731_MOLSC|nr:uncharacterized protein LY89DRAFT_725144 [Mollisia scopiformis]KUJ08216.1 hypothetical protein LY89DRAFT_725144 [Mollisia scopiformis]